MATVGINRELLTDLVDALAEYHKLCNECVDGPGGLRLCHVGQRIVRGRQLLVLAPVFADKSPFTYTIPVRPKSLRESINVATHILNRTEGNDHFRLRAVEHLTLLGRECDRKRPTGVGGKHDDLHTPECGCG